MVHRICLFLYVVVLVSCQVEPPIPPPTNTPTKDATAIVTAVSPTDTPLPSTPTSTPTPAPTPPVAAIPLGGIIQNQIGAGKIHPFEPLVIEFNQSMDTSSSEKPLLFSPDVNGAFSWNEAGTELTFKPKQRFALGQRYEIAQASDLDAKAGVVIGEPLVWQVSTLSEPMAAYGRGPRAAQAFGEDLLITSPIIFTHEMDWQSVVTAFSVEPSVPVVLSWLENGRLQQAHLPDSEGATIEAQLESLPEENQLIVQVRVPFDFYKEYQLTMTEAAVDTYQIPLSRAFVSEFKPAPVHVNISQSPDFFKLMFNYPLDLDQAVAALQAEPPIESAWHAEWDGNETVLSIASDAMLSNETYTLSFLAPLLHKNGKVLTRPEPLSVQALPVISEVYPRGDEWTQFDPETSIAVTFNRSMDETSVINAFQIQPDVPGELSYRRGNKLVFLPESGFFDGYTTYTVSLDNAAKDAKGNAVFSEPYSWRFNTGELHTDADFGVGTMVQVVDANGRRAVQYRSYQTEPITVTFGLYDLNQQQALQTLRGDWLDSQTLTQVITWTAVTEPREPEDYRYVNPQEVIIPSNVSPGAYLMTTDAGQFHDDLLVFLSGNTIAAKKAGSQVTIWTTDINGDVAENLDVIIVDETGKEVANGRSSAEGIFQTELPDGIVPAYVLASEGDDLVASGLSGLWEIGYSRGNAPPHTLINIYTDRPIYRPGHTVYFKAFLRSNDDVKMEPLPENSTVTARILDSRNNAVQTFDLVTNHFGSVNGQFELADGAMLGEYHVEIVAPDGRIVTQRFKVEDYRKPEYEVIVTTDKDIYLAGDTVSVTVDSTYFFGEPVVNADVAVSLFSGDSGSWWTYERPIEGKTDENGRFTLALSPRQGGYAVEATVDDGAHHSVSAFKQIHVSGAAENVSLDMGSYRKEPDSPVEIKVIVNDVYGQPVANRQVSLELQRYNSDNWNWTRKNNFQGQTDGNGRATFTFTPAEEGHYRVYARITDRLGNLLETNSGFMVFSSAYRYGRWFPTSDDLKIVSSQNSYVPGDTAQLFIQSAIAGPALLTLERADVRSQQVVDLTPPLTVVDIAIQENDAPNIFASVMAWKEQDNSVLGENSVPESRLLISTIELPVSLAHKTLNIEIKPDKEQYQPGDEATITLRATNSQGDPVSAELSLAVVDEAIFSLSPDLSASMLSTFYFKRPNQISNYSAMMPQRRLWYYVNNESGGMGGGGGDDTVALGEPRHDFKDTAAWYPVLQTDANGEVTVTFTLPDNITSWRMTAKGATADTQIGETVYNVTTWKPFIVRPTLPRILTAGDNLLLSALIHNNTDSDESATVTLTIDDLRLTIDDSPSQTITIPANNMATVGWPVTAVAAGTVTLTIQAENEGELLDAIELPLEIQPLAVPDVTMIQGQLTDSFTTDIAWTDSALPMSVVQIDLNRSIAGSMVQGLEYLTGYPYGCVEQTMSRALPNTVVARAFSQLGVSDPMMLENLEPLINASVQRLYGFQHGDGGWGWWTDDATHDYQTAWVIFGLTTTADAGYEVDQAVIDRGANWLLNHLDNMDVRTRAFALYSLAISGYGNAPLTLTTATQLDELDAFSQAALALALEELGETAVARELVDDLAKSAKETSGGMVYWPGETSDGYYHQKTMASDTRNTALALSAFVKIRPGHELEPGIVRYLMSQRKANGWGSTNETAFTILALTDHLLAAQEAAGEQNTAYTVSLNGQVVLTGTMAPDALSARLVLPADQMQVGENELLIEHEGKLYYQVTSRVYVEQEEIEAAGSVDVSRVYRDEETGRMVTAVTPNQLIQVKVTVNMPADASYVIVEDSLPGGLEALNENLGTTTLAVAGDNRPYWEQRGYNHKEIRDNRVSFFITDMAEGSHTFTYYARATHEGDFIAMPAEVYAMYDVSVWGRSASRPITVSATVE
jgi:alpha-2-macroglobulin